MGRVFIFGSAGLVALGLLFIAAIGAVTIYRWAGRRRNPEPPARRAVVSLLGRANTVMVIVSTDLSGTTILSRYHRDLVEKWLIDYQKEIVHHAR